MSTFSRQDCVCDGRYQMCHQPCGKTFAIPAWKMLAARMMASRIRSPATWRLWSCSDICFAVAIALYSSPGLTL